MKNQTYHVEFTEDEMALLEHLVKQASPLDAYIADHRTLRIILHKLNQA